MIIKYTFHRLLFINSTLSSSFFNNSSVRLVNYNKKCLLNQKFRQFSTTPKKQFIPPIAWLVIKPLSKLAAIVVGRGSRKWWQNLRPHLTKEIVSRHLCRNRTEYIVGITFVTVGGTVFYQWHLQVTPITNRKRFILFLPFQMEEVEELSKEAFNEKYGKNVITEKTKDVKRIMNVVDRLVKANNDLYEIRNTKWHVTVVDDPVVNACVFPSGHIIVFTGLLKFCRNDDELAAVLGHELSHAILQHTAENLSRSALIDFLSIMMVFTIWTVFPSDVTAGLVHYFSEKFLNVSLDLPFSRFLEAEADEVGIHLAAKACFDVRHMPLFWRRQANDFDLPEIFSTHPGHAHRADDIEKLLPQALLLREQCNCYKLPEKLVLPEIKKKDRPNQTLVAKN